MLFKRGGDPPSPLENIAPRKNSQFTSFFFKKKFQLFLFLSPFQIDKIRYDKLNRNIGIFPWYLNKEFERDFKKSFVVAFFLRQLILICSVFF